MNATLAGRLQTASHKPQLAALTGCRFLAASLVVLYHFWPRDFPAPALISSAISRGFMAVTFFFVLSGFVLTYRYAAEDLSGDARRRFWMARFCRIYPTYFLALICAAPIRLYAMQKGLLHYSLIKWCLGGILSIACVQAWLPQSAQSWNGPGWSISCEAFFYALFPFLLAWLSRQTQHAILRMVVLCWILSLVAPTVLRIAINCGARSGLHGWETGTSVEELLPFPFRRSISRLMSRKASTLCAESLYALASKAPQPASRRCQLTLYIIQYPAFVCISFLLQLMAFQNSVLKFGISFLFLVGASLALPNRAERAKHYLLCLLDKSWQFEPHR